MAGLYQRVSARGFPSSVAAGVTGEGALESQGSPVDPAHGQNVPGAASSTLPGQLPDTPAAVDVVVLEGAWGLPGQLVNPDGTPRTHAAPVPGWAGSYSDPELLVMHENSAEIHSADFGALVRHTQIQPPPEPAYEQWSSNDPGEAVGLAPLTGPQRVIGGRDAIQGYDLRNRYGFDAGHRERIVDTTPQPMFYLDPSERPFIVPQASGSFTPDDAIQGPGPWSSGLDGGNINATAPTAYEPPADTPTLAASQAGAPASAGWW
jgi:hypothetical protein